MFWLATSPERMSTAVNGNEGFGPAPERDVEYVSEGGGIEIYAAHVLDALQ